jgi:hypothetical protein
MSQSIFVQFAPTKNEYISVLHGYHLHVRKFWKSLIVLLIFETLLLISIAANHLFGNPLAFIILLIIPLIIIYTIVVMPLKLGRQFEKNERLSGESSWKFDNEHIIVKSKFSETKTDWGTYKKFIETSHSFILIYTANEQMIHFIPKRAFTSQKHEAAFRDLLNRKIHG